MSPHEALPPAPRGGRPSPRQLVRDIGAGIGVTAIAAATMWIASSTPAATADPASAYVGSGSAASATNTVPQVADETEAAAGPTITGAPMAAATTTVIDAGAEPRETLRFTPTIGTVQTVTVSQSGDQTVTVSGDGSDSTAATPYPTISVSAELTVTAVDETGVTSDVRLSGPTVTGTAA